MKLAIPSRDTGHMTDEPLLRKLQVKRGRSLRLIGAPNEYVERITPLPGESALIDEGIADVVQVFVRSADEVAAQAETATQSVGHGGVLWISYPKPSTEGSEIRWDHLGQLGWRPVTEISIDETWSAVRFRLEGDVTPRAR